MHCPRRSDNPTILPLFQMRSDLAKRWVLKPFDEACAARQAEQLGISSLVARILCLRGYAEVDSARRYLSSSLREDLPSPFQMIDMEPAVRRLIEAIDNHEQIGVWAIMIRRRHHRALPCW